MAPRQVYSYEVFVLVAFAGFRNLLLCHTETFSKPAKHLVGVPIGYGCTVLSSSGDYTLFPAAEEERKCACLSPPAYFRRNTVVINTEHGTSHESM